MWIHFDFSKKKSGQSSANIEDDGSVQQRSLAAKLSGVYSNRLHTSAENQISTLRFIVFTGKHKTSLFSVLIVMHICDYTSTGRSEEGYGL